MLSCQNLCTLDGVFFPQNTKGATLRVAPFVFTVGDISTQLSVCVVFLGTDFLQNVHLSL